MIEIINGKAYEVKEDGYLEAEVARRTDEIARIEELLVTLRDELAELTGKNEELTVQKQVIEQVK